MNTKSVSLTHKKIHAEFYPKTRREFFKTRRVLKNSPYVFPGFSVCFLELAARLGVSEVTVSRWMTDGANGRNPSIPTLQKIADILGTAPDYLLGKDGKELQPTQNTSGNGVNWGAILAGTALTATAVIGLVALAKAMGKLNESDKEQIENILNRE